MCNLVHGFPTSTALWSTEWMLHWPLEFIFNCERPASDLQFTVFICLHRIVCMQKDTAGYVLVFLVFTFLWTKTGRFLKLLCDQMPQCVAVTQQNTLCIIWVWNSQQSLWIKYTKINSFLFLSPDTLLFCPVNLSLPSSFLNHILDWG